MGIAGNQGRLPKGGDPEMGLRGRRCKQPDGRHSGENKVRGSRRRLLCARRLLGLGPHNTHTLTPLSRGGEPAAPL